MIGDAISGSVGGLGVGLGSLTSALSSLDGGGPSAAAVAFADVELEKSSMEGDLVSIEVEDNDQWIDRATIVVDDPHRKYLQNAREGLILTVDLGWKKHAVIFEGVVAKADSISGPKGQKQTQIVALDLSCLLERRRQDKAEDHEGTLGVILEKLLGRPEYKGKIQKGTIEIEKDDDKEPTYTTRNPLRQAAGQSDWKLIQRLAKLYDARAFVEYNEGASRFYWIPAKTLLESRTLGSLNYCPGHGKLKEFKFQRFAVGASEASARSLLDPVSGKVESSAPQAPKEEDPKPLANPEVQAQLQKLSPGQAERYNKALELAAGAELQPKDLRPSGGREPGASKLAGLREKRGENRAFKLGLRGQGVCVGNIQLRAKGNVTIFGIDPLYEGGWYLRRVRHFYTRVRDADGKDRSTFSSKFEVTR